MNNKFELLKDDTKIFNGVTVYRIKALKNIRNVKKGDLGGYIEKESNLVHYDNSWVDSSSIIYGLSVIRKSFVYNSVICNTDVVNSFVSMCELKDSRIVNCKVYNSDIYNCTIFGEGLIQHNILKKCFLNLHGSKIEDSYISDTSQSFDFINIKYAYIINNNILEVLYIRNKQLAIYEDKENNIIFSYNDIIFDNILNNIKQINAFIELSIINLGEFMLLLLWLHKLNKISLCKMFNIYIKLKFNL